MSYSPDQQAIIDECASAYLFNLIYVADQDDEGGFDHPLEPKYAKLAPLIDTMLKEGILTTEAYEEDGEEGMELVPGPSAEQHLKALIKRSRSYKSKDCDGLEALRQAFYLKMDTGALEVIPEDEGPWYDRLLDLGFYQSLAPQSAKTVTHKESTDERDEEAAPPTAPPAAMPDYSPEATAMALEANDPLGDSAFDIKNPDEMPSELPTKVYLYKKPAFIYLGLTVLFLLLSRSGSFFWFCGLASGLATFFFAYRKVQIGPDGVHFMSIAGSKHIPLRDIEQTDLSEEDHNPKEIIITGRNGDSIKVSKWLDDLRGALQLLKNHLRSM